MPLETKDSILVIDDQNVTALDVPEWNGSVYLRVMSGEERDELERYYSDAKEKGRGSTPENIRARVACLTLCDSQGARLFDSNGDVHALGRKSAAALDRIFELAMRLNRIGEQDVGQLAGNSEAA